MKFLVSHGQDVTSLLIDFVEQFRNKSVFSYCFVSVNTKLSYILLYYIKLSKTLSFLLNRITFQEKSIYLDEDKNIYSQMVVKRKHL